MSTLRVVAYRSLDAAAHLEEALEALNLASARPMPYNTLRFIRTFLAHDEFAEPGMEPLLLAALRGDEVVGFLPLRRRPQKVFGLPSVRIEFLLSHDVSRPTMCARAEDEAACAEAFWRHLLDHEPRWSLVELKEQDADSPLQPPAWVEGSGCWVRRFENFPNATLWPSTYADAHAYFGSLSSNQRRSVRHTTNRLLRTGRVEVATCRDPRALGPLLDLYLDVEARSWKAGTDAAIVRRPERLAFFRALSRPGEAPALWYSFLLLDELPIAAELNASFAGDEYGLEVAHDDEHRDLGAANLLFLVSIGEAIAARVNRFDLMSNFAWQKQRWGAVVTDTSAIQVYRTLGLFSLKALGGRVRRRFAREEPSQRHATVNLTKPADAGQAAGARPPRTEERRRCREVLCALERDGVPLQRLHGPALLEALPFRPHGER